MERKSKKNGIIDAFSASTQKRDNTYTSPSIMAPYKPVNTTSEFIDEQPKEERPVLVNGRLVMPKKKIPTRIRNKDANPGLINVSPEFDLLTLGGGGLSAKSAKAASTIASKADDSMLNAGERIASVYKNKPLRKPFSQKLKEVTSRKLDEFMASTTKATDRAKGVVEDELLGVSSIAKSVANGGSLKGRIATSKSSLDRITKAQDEAAKEAMDFTKNWIYDKNGRIGVFPNESVSAKMKAIEDGIESSEWAAFRYPNYSTVSSNNPVMDGRTILTNSSKIRGGISNDLSSDFTDYIRARRGSIGGSNNNSNSVVLRNYGGYRLSPKRVADVVVHENAHSMQDISLNGKKWIHGLVKHNDDTGYWTASDKTAIGAKFKEAMVSPEKKTNAFSGNISYKNSWESSPAELHSELMVARHNMLKGLKEKTDYSESELIEFLRNPTDEMLDAMIDSQNLNRFFKKGVDQETKRSLLRMLPASAGGYAISKTNK